MKIKGKHYRAIWPAKDGVEVIDQTKLPHEFATVKITTLKQAADAIRKMVVRGAPLIGATAAYGVALAMREDASDDALDRAIETLQQTRPTAVNLQWALKRMRDCLRNQPREARAGIAWKEAAAICDEDVETCRKIGEHGLELLRSIADKKGGKTLNILTHCNAGWLGCVDWGTALAPIYMAHDAGLPVHVWVDETRPRNQGAALTAFELGAHGVPHTIIVDNAGGYYMRAREVDLCIVGCDRVAANGDVANKIGTYLKALAAKDNNVPFYVALPSTTFDWTLANGDAIPIESRDTDEITTMRGRLKNGRVTTVTISAPGSPAANPGFDVTPAHLVTGFITERGLRPATVEGLRSLVPNTKNAG